MIEKCVLFSEKNKNYTAIWAMLNKAKKFRRESRCVELLKSFKNV
jgi:hypothetical protein